MNDIVTGNDVGSERLSIATETFSTECDVSDPMPVLDAEADCGDDVDVAETEDEPREHLLPCGRRRRDCCEPTSNRT